MKVLLGVMIVLLTAATPAHAGRWFNSFTVFSGIETPGEHSPYCWYGGKHDNEITSNIGYELSLWQNDRGTFDISHNATHQSCVFSEDADQLYNAFGIRFRWVLWRRR
jgi:hypothetical protein